MKRHRHLWEIRIPTVAAILVLLVSIVITLSVIKGGVFYIGKASPDITPQNIEISNITDSSFAVSFTTNEKTVGAVSVESPDEPVSLAFDDRNRTGGDQKGFYSHHITVGDLKPQAVYKFAIISDGNTYNNDGQKFAVTTGSIIDAKPSDQKPIFGKVILPNGEASSDTLVILENQETQKISAITKAGGEFTIPINAVRNTALNNYVSFSLDTPVNIVLARQDMKSSVKILYKDAQNTPNITLSQDYDFLSPSDEIKEETTPSSSLKIPVKSTKAGEIKISTPRDGESFIDQKPQFKGTALPNQKVKITIHSDENIQVETRSDTNGIWTYRPQNPLSVGEHTITIESQDGFGIIRKITQSFTIFASGSQVIQTATPSATPTITLTPSPSLTSTPTITPTITLSPTPIASTTPTLTTTPAPTITTVPSPTQTNTPIPTLRPGGTIQSVTLTFLSVLFIVTGATLLFIL